MHKHYITLVQRVIIDLVWSSRWPVSRWSDPKTSDNTHGTTSNTCSTTTHSNRLDCDTVIFCVLLEDFDITEWWCSQIQPTTWQSLRSVHSFTVVIRIIVSSKLRFRTLSNCHFEASWQLQRHTMVIFLSMKCRALWVSSVHAIHTSVCSIVEFRTKIKCRTVTRLPSVSKQLLWKYWNTRALVHKGPAQTTRPNVDVRLTWSELPNLTS